MVVPTDNFAFEERYVTVTVANSGRRPLTITGVGFLRKTRSAGELLINESIKNGPTDIPEGKSHTFLIAQSSLPLDDIRKVIARDALGNVWKRKVKF